MKLNQNFNRHHHSKKKKEAKLLLFVVVKKINKFVSIKELSGNFCRIWREKEGEKIKEKKRRRKIPFSHFLLSEHWNTKNYKTTINFIFKFVYFKFSFFFLEKFILSLFKRKTITNTHTR